MSAERRLSRTRLLIFFAQQPPATVLLEACGSAHHWARQLQHLGHTVRLLPPHDVHRYVRRNKTDRTDTRALLEANRNDDIHPVPIKSVEQQAIASLHRLRSTWLATRTARLNTVRGLLREFGITIPVGAHYVMPQIRELAANPSTTVTTRAAIDASCGAAALRARQGRAACGGALRAALTRAHAAPSVQLCDEGSAFVVRYETAFASASSY